MRKLIAILIIPFLFSSCEDGLFPNRTKEGTVDLNFKAFYDADNLVLGDYYDYPDGNGTKIKFKVFTFFISDVKLSDENISDALLFEFREHHSTAATAPDGETLTIENVTVGDYDEVDFGVGITAALNSTNPADYKSSEALSETSMYWDWRGSYIFAMVEGSIDTGGIKDIDFIYHMGSDALFRDVDFSTPITVEKNKTTTLNFEINMKDIFVTDTKVFDIKEAQTSHSGLNDEEIAQEIMTNLTNAIRLND